MTGPIHQFAKKLIKSDVLGRAVEHLPEEVRDALQHFATSEQPSLIRRGPLCEGETAQGVGVFLGEVREGAALRGVNLMKGTVTAGTLRGINVLVGVVRGGSIEGVNVVLGDVHAGKVTKTNLVVGDIHGGKLDVNVLLGDVFGGEVSAKIHIGDVAGGSVKADHHTDPILPDSDES